MISHGSQIITDLRRGTWRITSMTRGTFDILGLFSSPYSTAATAALKAAFSTAQWETIRDYGFAHPEIVGYMNAYAPEDPKIAYSLVEGIGTRLIYPSDNNTYALSDINYGSGDVCIAIKGLVTSLSTSPGTFSGLDGSSSYPRYYFIYIGDGQYLRTVNKTGAWADSYVQDSPIIANEMFYARSTIKANGEYSVKLNNNNEITKTGGLGSVIPNKKITMWAIYNINLASVMITCRLLEVGQIEINNGTSQRRYVPFVRNGQNELLDLITGQLAERVGSFTISESPAS